MLYQGRKAFATKRWQLHLLRGVLTFFAISLWSQGIQRAPITIATIMSFTVPIFTLLLAHFFLKETVKWPVWIATITGFIGIALILKPDSQGFNQGAIFFTSAAFLFSILDIINKKYVNQEPIICMLFYATLIACMLIIYPAYKVWQPIALSEFKWLLILGIGGNLILYLLLKAFSYTTAASLAPVRYVELLISMVMSYGFFNELPSAENYLGTGLIISTTLFISYYQAKCAGST